MERKKQTMSTYRTLALACFLGVVIMPGGARAECTGGRVALQEALASSTDWFHDGDIDVGDGKMVLKMTPDKSRNTAEYQPLQLYAVDPHPTQICADFRFPADVGDGLQAGILFWSILDRRQTFDGYLWLVSSNAYVTLLRLNNGQSSIIYDGPSAAARGGANASNSLAVSMDGHGVSLFVNGALTFEKRDVFQPNSGTRAGVAGILLSPARRALGVQVTNFRITMGPPLH